VVDSLKSSIGTKPETSDSLAPANGAPVPEEGDLRLPAAPPQALESTPDVLPPAGDSPSSLDLPPARTGLDESAPEPAQRPESTTESVSTLALPASPTGAPTQSPDDAVSAGPEEGQGAPVIDGRKQVVITFNAPSWVDVRDSERKFKLFGEVSKGSRKVLGGQPPYKMVIGNAQAVSITVNGEPFDLTSYAKGNVARFTLDP
jgi:cytoskeleton protein RodZ